MITFYTVFAFVLYGQPLSRSLASGFFDAHCFYRGFFFSSIHSFVIAYQFLFSSARTFKCSNFELDSRFRGLKCSVKNSVNVRMQMRALIGIAGQRCMRRQNQQETVDFELFLLNITHTHINDERARASAHTHTQAHTHLCTNTCSRSHCSVA